MKILIADDEYMVLQENREVVEAVCPDAEIMTAGNYLEALQIVGETGIDVVLLDIEMPGITGLELAKRIRELNPEVNIIFATAYSEYAVEAFSMYASGYLLKPLTREAWKTALENLRHPVQEEQKKLQVQCFGKFEVFYHGKPVPFARAKAKEIFAYLIDIKGAAANTGELCAILWEDSTEVEKNRHYLRNLLADLKRALRQCGAEDVLIIRRNQFSIDTGKVDCDYYRYLNGEKETGSSYEGEYMSQYSWAEHAVGLMEN